MNKHQQSRLEQRFDALPRHEQQALLKAARKARANDQTRARAGKHKEHNAGLNEHFEPAEGRRATGKRKTDPIRLYALKLLAQQPDETDATQTADQHQPDTDTRTGIAARVGRRRCLVRPLVNDTPAPEEDAVDCHLPAKLAGNQQAELTVGDRVAFTTDTEAQPTITGVLPRRTVLTRPDPRTRQPRAIAANIDAVVIVVSVVSPPLHPRLIDRYLIAVEDSWVETQGAHAQDPDPAQAIIAVNKIDLLPNANPNAKPNTSSAATADDQNYKAKLAPYEKLGIPVVPCSVTNRTGIDELQKLLAGKTVAFVGHSGVGKSSLTNAVAGTDLAQIGGIGAAANRGTHTTTLARMHEIATPYGPIRVIDTPGVRAFALSLETPAEVRDAFPEIRRLRQNCKFADCTHTHEPACAVRQAVHNGTFPKTRYDAYLRILAEIDPTLAAQADTD